MDVMDDYDLFREFELYAAAEGAEAARHAAQQRSRVAGSRRR